MATRLRQQQASHPNDGGPRSAIDRARRSLVDRPFPAFSHHIAPKSWAGAYIRSWEEDRKIRQIRLDESWQPNTTDDETLDFTD